LPTSAGSSKPEWAHPDDHETREQGGNDDRVNRGAPLLGPVDVLEVQPQRELVECERRADAEADRRELPPRRPQVARERQKARQEQEGNSPHEMVDVQATLGFEVARPPRNALGMMRVFARTSTNATRKASRTRNAPARSGPPRSG
jgi:hypothetical protein